MTDTQASYAECRGCQSAWFGSPEEIAPSIMQHIREFEHWVEFNPVKDPHLLEELDTLAETGGSE